MTHDILDIRLAVEMEASVSVHVMTIASPLYGDTGAGLDFSQVGNTLGLTLMTKSIQKINPICTNNRGKTQLGRRQFFPGIKFLGYIKCGSGMTFGPSGTK